MPREARTAEEIVEYLLAHAIPNGECLDCHLAGFADRMNRVRHYVQVNGRNGKKWRVTRLVWHIKKGPIINDLWVLHKCDNQKCINLDHLFLGTPKDNTDDMISKGRQRSDPEVGVRRREFTSKLIRPLLEQGFNRNEIARRLRISPSTVWNYISERGPYRE